MSEKYYVAGCVDNGLSTEVVEDEHAEFWTLYERDSEGLSEAIIDCLSRKEAETAMAVYVERDQLIEQVRSLAAEVYAAKSHVENSAKAIHNWNQWADSCDRIAENIDTPNTDAILNEVRARELDAISDELTALDTVGSTGAIAYAIRQKAAAIRAGEVPDV